MGIYRSYLEASALFRCGCNLCTSISWIVAVVALFANSRSIERPLLSMVLAIFGLGTLRLSQKRNSTNVRFMDLVRLVGPPPFVAAITSKNTGHDPNTSSEVMSASSSKKNMVIYHFPWHLSKKEWTKETCHSSLKASNNWHQFYKDNERASGNFAWSEK